MQNWWRADVALGQPSPTPQPSVTPPTPRTDRTDCGLKASRASNPPNLCVIHGIRIPTPTKESDPADQPRRKIQPVFETMEKTHRILGRKLFVVWWLRHYRIDLPRHVLIHGFSSTVISTCCRAATISVILLPAGNP